MEQKVIDLENSIKTKENALREEITQVANAVQALVEERTEIGSMVNFLMENVNLV